jgi:N-acetylglutamate synthase-like GNAT family acetyltransferase
MSSIAKFEIVNSFANYADFETGLSYANQVWEKAFGNTYDINNCPSNNIIVGYDSNQKPLCCAIYDIEDDAALISCVASNPTNKGYGTILMTRLNEELKDKKIKYAVLNISLDENKDRLERFYEKFGYCHLTDDSVTFPYEFDYDETEEIQKYAKL